MTLSVKLLVPALLLLFLISSYPAGSGAQLEWLVDESTHFIEVPAGSFDPGQTIKLAATVYQPRFLHSAPAAIYVHGWGGHRLTGTDNLAYYIAAAGYIVVSYTARGFGGGESGGRVTLAGPDELEDLRHVIDWLTTDPDHVIGPRVTGVGVIGGSYGGGHSFQISSDPRVSVVAPLVGWTDLEQALFPNGAINYRLGIAEFYSGLDQQVGEAPFFNYSRLQFDIFDAAAEGRLPGASVRQALRTRSIAQRDEQGREILDPARQPRVPVFIVQSWDDYLFPSTQVLDVYSQIEAPKQIYLGRRGHPPGDNTFEGEEVYIGAQILRWFDHYLRGIGGLDSRSVTSARAPFPLPLYTATRFPSDDIATEVLFLKPGGALSPKKKKGGDGEETAGGIFRPGQIRSSHLGAEIPTQAEMLSASVDLVPGLPQRLIYTSRPWDSDTEVIGPSEFTFLVSSGTSADIDLIVRTFDVAPDGREDEVTVGVARVTGLSPGEIRRVTLRDYGDDWVYRAGHSLRIKVSNTDFPAFRPPGENDNVASRFTLHLGRVFRSKVKLSIR